MISNLSKYHSKVEDFLKRGQMKLPALILWSLVSLKVILLCLFSSDYQNHLFIPFVRHFLGNFDNPWQYFYENPLMGVEFPYSPVMLYISSLFYAPVYWSGIDSVIIDNLFFKLPILVSDLIIFYLLTRLRFDRFKILIYYFASPIIIYACFVHSQMDLVPTAILFFAVYLLMNNKIVLSAVVMGLAMATKFHVVAALPLMALYALRKNGFKEAARFMLISPCLFLFFVFPYLGEGYTALVLNNPKQALVYDAFKSIGDVKIYLPFLLVALLYARFSVFRRINNDLFYTFAALVFSSFVALIVPAPGWYVWLFPFLSIFFIKVSSENPESIKLYVALNVMYLLYMIFFYPAEFADLIFLNQVIDCKIADVKLRNITFTFLEAVLIAIMYAFYKFGIKSNFVYRKDYSTVIGIAGDSGVGKTTILSDLEKLFGKKLIKLEGDADHKWERNDAKWQSFTHLNPKANYLYRQYEDMVNLKYGKIVSRPDYDHSAGKFTAPQPVRSNDYIVLSGLHTFYLPKMRKAIDLKVYVETDEPLRIHWKLNRDKSERGRSREEIVKQIEDRKQDSLKYIYPQKGFADLIVSYFIVSEAKLGTPNQFGLKVTLDSNIPMEGIINRLSQTVRMDWDYSEDLRTQIISFNGAVEKTLIEDVAKEAIVNLEDLLTENPIWLDGYRGLVQLMVLLNLSEKMKISREKNSEEI